MKSEQVSWGCFRRTRCSKLSAMRNSQPKKRCYSSSLRRSLSMIVFAFIRSWNTKKANVAMSLLLRKRCRQSGKCDSASRGSLDIGPATTGCNQLQLANFLRIRLRNSRVSKRSALEKHV